MAEGISKLQRWLDLVALLVGRRLPVSVEEILERVPAYATKWIDADETGRASVRRMFERDKDELRSFGIPIETVAYQINYGTEQAEGYCIRRRDFYLPYLKLVRDAAGTAGGAEQPYALFEIELTEADAGAALDALREAVQIPAFPLVEQARSALRKLSFDLDPDEFGTAPVFYVDRPGAEELRELVRPLSDALLARKTVRFRYHGIYRGHATEREVHPFGLFFQRANWYLVADDVRRQDLRVFRVGRIEEIEVNRRAPHTPDYEIPSSFRLESYLQRDPWELGEEEPIGAHVLFRFPTSLWAARNRHGDLIEERPDGSVVRGFSVQQVNPFLRWLLTLGGEAEILSPPELAAELRNLAREVASLYELAS